MKEGDHNAETPLSPLLSPIPSSMLNTSENASDIDFEERTFEELNTIKNSSGEMINKESNDHCMP